MLASIKYHQFTTPLGHTNCEVLTAEWDAAEAKYEEAVSKHEKWKAMKAKEAWAEALRLKEVARSAKLEALRQQALEKKWLRLEAEEKEQLWLEDEEKQWRLKQKELVEAMAKKVLDDLVKAKEKEDEDNEKLLAAAGFVPSSEEGDSESDPTDLKAVATAELRKRHKIAEGKKKVGSAETRKHISGAVYTGNECCGKCQTDKATCFVHGRVRTCQRCHIKKVQCTFNKGDDNGSSMESTSVLEILQDISARLACLEDKMEEDL
ncbi:hypothetical protein EV421DRAFT_1900599 [Armillaria borealis]|uniref:Uncharacterized protein n=1 Tax=Armillaria borealis TaxID=47425 RepID=A0AA39MUV6_9AGAR|nr:hypothetical protein EV421DRAFT_1900599 [Armillaria borealis]